MTEKIYPVRVVDGTELVITMRRRSADFLSRDLGDAEVRENAENIRRLIRSILEENNAYSQVDIRETARMLCPECRYEWEIDPEDGLPVCCYTAQSSWKATE